MSFYDRRELGGSDQGDLEPQDLKDVRDIGDKDIGWTSRRRSRVGMQRGLNAASMLLVLCGAVRLLRCGYRGAIQADHYWGCVRGSQWGGPLSAAVAAQVWVEGLRVGLGNSDQL